jgi:hypothetical protein
LVPVELGDIDSEAVGVCEGVTDCDELTVWLTLCVCDLLPDEL